MSNNDDMKLLAELSPHDLKLVDELTDDQYAALINIVRWSRQFPIHDRGHILVGYAGTGKTHCLRLITKILSSVVLCAPTNKAVKELRKLETGLTCCTIYSLLGLRMEQNENVLKLSKTDPSKASKYRFVVLDECGMTNSALYAHIEAAMRLGTRFLFVGDPKQLPPVGETSSLVWNSFPTSPLFEVVRHDNQILSFATHVRKTKKVSDIVLKSDHTKSEGVWYLPQDKFEDRIQKFANSGAFEENTKAIAWRNKTVDIMNNIVRLELYGKAIHKSKFIVGDRIVFTAPYEIEEDGTLIFTDDEAEITHITVAVHRDYDLQCYYLTIKIEGREHIVTHIHETSQSQFDSLLNTIANEARIPLADKPIDCRHWGDFWDLKNSFCSIKYAYAITAHRSQGSTYDNAFVDVYDIMMNSDKKEAKKCLYVAVTRPSKKLFMS